MNYRAGYVPYLPEVFRVPYPYCFRCPYHGTPATCGLDCLGEITKLFEYVVSPEDIAALIFEPVQGEGGYIVPPVRWMKGWTFSSRQWLKQASCELPDLLLAEQQVCLLALKTNLKLISIIWIFGPDKIRAGDLLCVLACKGPRLHYNLTQLSQLQSDR